MNKIRKIIIINAILLLLVGCAKESYITMEEESSIGIEEVTETNVDENIYVDICGAVKKPGVYKVPVGSRLFEVIALAGGYTKDAKEDYINRAKIVLDGEQVRILTQTEAMETYEDDTRININTASETVLCTIPGIGKSRAESIISYRETQGSFQSVEDIKKVAGIKDGLYEKMKEYIIVK